MPLFNPPPKPSELVNLKSPGTTISLDGIAGDDNNDGFAAPVQTVSKLQQVLENYNWEGQSLTLSFSNYTGGDVLIGSGIYGYSNIAFILFGNVLTSNFDLRFFDKGLLSFIGGTFDNCELVLSNVLSAGTTSTSFVNKSSGDLFNLTRVQSFSPVIQSITDCSCDNVIRSTSCSKILASFGSLSGTNSFDVLTTDDYINFAELTAGAPINIPGRLINIASDVAGGATIKTNINLTETTPSVYPSSLVLNGTMIRGSFVDDAAAATAGVQSGHLYNNTTLGAIAVKS